MGETFEVTKSSGGIVSIAAVVSSEDDDGVVGDAELFKFGNNAAYAVVESLDHACTFWIEVFVLFVVERFGFCCVFFHQCGWCHVGAVQGVVGKVEQEGFVFFLVQELESRIGEFVGEEVAFFAVIQTGHAEGGEVFSGAFGLCPFATADVDVEAVFLRDPGGFGVPESPLSKSSGLVARLFQHRSDGRGVGREGDESITRSVGAAMTMTGVEAGHDDAAGGTANRGAGVGALKLHPFFGQLCHDGCFDELSSVRRKIPRSGVIDHHEDDVGFPGGENGDWEQEEQESLQHEAELHGRLKPWQGRRSFLGRMSDLPGENNRSSDDLGTSRSVVFADFDG